MVIRNKNKVSLSVVVPVYNVEKYLDDCLKSLTLQTEPFEEIILVNDGSADNSRKICEEYCLKYRNMRLINQENQGQSVARNHGMMYANGDYLLFIDSDDYITLDTAEIIRGKLQEKALDILYYNANIQYDIEINKSVNTYVRDESLYGYGMSGLEYLIRAFPQSYIIGPCMAAYKRSFLQRHDITFPEGVYYEDNFFQLKAVINANFLECISNRFYVRRYREDSTITSLMTTKKCQDIVTIQLLIWEYLFPIVRGNKEKDFFRSFIASGWIQTLFMLESCSDDGVVLRKKESLLEKFLEYWSNLFLLDELTWGDSGALLLVLQLLRDKKNEHLVERYFGAKANFEECYRKVKEDFAYGIITRMKKLPLHAEGKKIGIYGIGNHTLKLLELYQTFMGKICSQFYFIVTEKKEDIFLDKRIVRSNDIPQDTDAIIISSRIYQREMLEKLSEHKMEEKACVIYEDRDIFDLVTAGKILSKEQRD